MGVSTLEAAEASIRIVNSQMAKVLRIVTVERGHDPREFTLVAYGGAGPMHAAELAEDLGVRRVIVPRSPGLFSAVGLLVTDLRHDLVRSVLRRTEEIDPRWLDSLFEEMAREGAEILSREGVSPESMAFVRWVEARYAGQSHELPVELPAPASELGVEGIEGLFHERHRRSYGYSMPEHDVEVVNARVTAIGSVPRPRPAPPPAGASAEGALKGRRRAFFSERGWFEAPVYERDRMPAGAEIEGPAIVEQYDSTTLVPPGWRARVDSLGNLILEAGGVAR